MRYIEIPITKATIFLTESELVRLLMQDMTLYKTALGRGKAFKRTDTQRKREREKFEGTQN